MSVAEERLDNKNTFLRNLAVYTFLFCVIAAGVYIEFLYFKRTLVVNGTGNIDGWAQHYPLYVEIKQIITDMIKGHGFCFWAWDIGLGEDVWMLFKSRFLDPLTYIVIAFPVEHMDIGYSIMIVVRQYLTGITFMVFAKYINMSRMQIIFGGLCYAFSGWAIEASLNQGTFATAMILFPLLVLGVEKMLQEHSPWVFSISVALLMIYSTLWAYDSAIIIFIYFIIRYFSCQERSIKDFACRFASFIVFGALGILLSAFSFLQTFIKTTGATTESTVAYDALYPIREYLATPSSLFSYYNFHSGMSQIFLACVLVVFIPIAILNIRKKSTAAIMMLLLFLAGLFPVTGSILNGFSYSMCRWYFVMTFFMVWATAECLTIETLKKKRNLIIMALFIAAAAAWCLFGYQYLQVVTRVGVICAVIGGTFGLLTIAVLGIWARMDGQKGWQRVCVVFLALLMTGNIVLAMNERMLPGQGENIYSYMELDETYADYMKSCQRVAAELQAEDTSFFRSERIAETKVPPNKNMFHDMRSIYLFSSAVKKTWHEYNKIMGNNNGYFDRTTSFSNGNRVGLDTLMGVKYYLIDKSDTGKKQEEYVPYGYKHREVIDGIDIYENQYNIGLGTTYDGFITESELMEYPYLEREQVIMQAAVVPDDYADKLSGINHLSTSDIKTGVEEVDYEITSTEGIEMGDHSFTCASWEGAINITIPEVEDAVLVVSFDNLVREKCSYDEYLKLTNWQPEYKSEKAAAIDKECFEDNEKFKIAVKKNGVKMVVSNRKGKNQGFDDVFDFNANLGYFDTVSGEIKIQFDNVGHYSYDALHVYAVPMDSYEKAAKKLAKNKLDITSYDGDVIKGTVNAKEDSIAYLSILNTPGWTVSMDGKPVQKINDVNVSFTGWQVPAGEHEIVMHYESPGLKKGLLVSAAALIILIAMGVIGRRRREH